MSWNHRVLRNKKYDWVAVHEVYYSPEGKIDGYSKNPVTIGADDIEGIKWQLDRIREACDKPIIEVDEDGQIIGNN